MQISFCFCKTCICLKFLENIHISVKRVFVLNTVIFIGAALLFDQGVPKRPKVRSTLKVMILHLSGKFHALMHIHA